METADTTTSSRSLLRPLTVFFASARAPAAENGPSARAVLQRALPYVLSAASVALALWGALLFDRHGFRNMEFPVFLFAIATTVWYRSIGPAILAFLLSSLAFDYYFTEPRYRLTVAIADIPYFAAFLVFSLALNAFSVVRRRVEHELRSSRKQLEAQLAHVARVATMGEMVASIAHEVNQPLAAILMNGETSLRWLSADPPNAAKASAIVECVVADATRAGEFIARIRALARKTTAEKKRVDLNDTIEQVVLLVRGQLEKNGVTLYPQFAKGLPPVMGDGVQLQQVVLNLFLNAVEAMSTVADRSRDLTVATANGEADHVVVAVRDTGIGIGPESRDRIFEAFYTTKRTGMGMGLSICRAIVQGHGGRLWVEANDDGPGTTFRFTVPKAPAS